MQKTPETLISGAAALSLIFSAGALADSAAAQSRRTPPAPAATFHFQPDANAVVAGRNVPIDLALLGPNGEETAGFYASLDPFHARPFTALWQRIYGPLMQGNPHNTSRAAIDRVMVHLQGHGIPKADLIQTYRQAKAAWQANPRLRTNAPQP